MEAIWSVSPEARFVHVDPIIHVIASQKRPEEQPDAEAYRLSQFQAWDMLAGRLWPELGGQERYLDILGANYYPHNQWFYDIKESKRSHEFQPLTQDHALYRPLREILREVYTRYRRPMFIAETGAEDDTRPGWFRYVYEGAAAAMDEGAPLEGIC